MVVSDSLGAPKGYEDSPRGWIWARGCMLRLLVSYFPAGFFFSQPPGLCSSESAPAAPRCSAQHLAPTESMWRAVL